jgi:hypothetical protein
VQGEGRERETSQKAHRTMRTDALHCQGFTPLDGFRP